MARPHSPLSAVRVLLVGRKIGTVAPLNSQSLPCFRLDELDHDIVGDHAHGKAIDWGTAWPSVLAGAARAFAASVAIIAVTKPAPPVQSELAAGRNEAAASWAQGPNNIYFPLE